MQMLLVAFAGIAPMTIQHVSTLKVQDQDVREGEAALQRARLCAAGAYERAASARSRAI